MLSPFARALLAASALSPVAPPIGGSTTLNYSLLNPMLEDTGGQFEVYHVTNLNNSGAGSFPDAVTGGSSAVTRIVVFDVSGGCYMPITGGDTFSYDDLSPSRSNLYVAGQTAPLGPDGRGFTFFGGLMFQGVSRVVVEHIIMSPRTAHMNADKENGSQFRFTHGSASEKIVVRNCTLKNTLDASFVLQPANGQATGGRNIVFIHNLVAQPGQNTSANDYYSAHGYSFMSNARNYRVLGAFNLMANGAMRTPLLRTGSHTAWINNYFWDFGGPNNRGWASEKMGYPVFFDVRNDPGGSDDWYHADEPPPSSFALSFPNYIIADIIGNHYEGGPSTRIPLYYRNGEGGPLAQYMIGVMSAEDYNPIGGDGPSDWGHYLHLDNNRVETRFDQSWPDGFTDGVEIGSVTFYTGTVIGYDAPNSQPSNHITWRDDPRFAYPFTPVPWQDVRGICLAYAGAHPANREPDDARIVSAIAARTHTSPNAYADPPEDPVTTTVAAVSVPVVGTSSTGTLTGSHALVAGYGSGSITQLEQWLHGLHMGALGIPDGAPDYDPNIAGAWIADTTEAAA